ncbi:unnamed protein product [marine sediment metagenome]|uniref:Uncharacterized protein n=1 Tax=marine sediment metagenome TaxID=412755 RepID=X1HRC9_9ZZZZ
MAEVRSQALLLMRKAFRKGQSASSFIQGMKAKGLSYRRTVMLSDWRSVNELERKEGAFRYVRKDYYPSKQSLAEVEWKLSQEFMYKVKVQSRLRPDEPITDRFVNIMSDIPMTPRQVQEQVESKWAEWEKYAPEELVDLQVWSAVHKVGL